jgi:hypothetical protein
MTYDEAVLALAKQTWPDREIVKADMEMEEGTYWSTWTGQDPAVIELVAQCPSPDHPKYLISVSKTYHDFGEAVRALVAAGGVLKDALGEDTE